MRHLKKSLFTVAFALLGFFILYALLEGMLKVLIYPILAVVAFAILYLWKQGERDHENNIKDGVRYTTEEQEAEYWIRHDLAPKTLRYLKHKHWQVIIYSFLLLVIVAYLWSYLSTGPDTALRNTVFASVLFFILCVYSLYAPHVFNFLFRLVPKNARKHIRSDWVRGYLFLLPLSAIAYILSPFVGAGVPIAARIATLPGFFFGYTFIFLSGLAVLYLHQEAKKEEEKHLRKSVKNYLNNK